MIILGCDGLTLSFGERDVLSDVSFSVQEGDRVGIVGENGAGKTSLLKMITGEYDGKGNVYISPSPTATGLSSPCSRALFPTSSRGRRSLSG